MQQSRHTTGTVMEVTEDEVSFRPRHRARDDAEMDITPMIDITFLLLIFFLVASRMDTDAIVELPPARYGTAVSAKNSVILTVAEGPDASATIYLGDGKVDENRLATTDPVDQEQQIRQYVSQQLEGPQPKEHLLIKAERGVKHREVARVARAAGSAADSQLFVAVLEVD